MRRRVAVILNRKAVKDLRIITRDGEILRHYVPQDDKFRRYSAVGDVDPDVPCKNLSSKREDTIFLYSLSFRQGSSTSTSRIEHSSEE